MKRHDLVTSGCLKNVTFVLEGQRKYKNIDDIFAICVFCNILEGYCFNASRCREIGNCYTRLISLHMLADKLHAAALR